MESIASDLIAVPPDAGARARRALGLGRDAPLRVFFFAGPGDVIGTHGHWRAGRHDPRVPVVTYSAQFYELARALDAAFLVIAQEGGPPGHAVEVPGGRFEVIPRSVPDDPAGWMRSHLQLTRAAAARARAWQPHVVLLSSDFGTEALSELPRGARTVLSLHNTYWPYAAPRPGLKEWLKRLRLARRLARVDAAVCTSEECRRQLARLVPRLAASGVETPQLPGTAPAPLPDRPGGPPRRLLFLGRLTASKGVFDLLEAFADIARRFPDAELAFAGSGDAQGPLADRIAELGPGANVRLLGRLDAAGVHAALDRTDLLVCPTRSSFPEGLALVCLEAASHGVPSLMSSVVPARDALEGACAIFPADDRDALAATLAELMDDPARAAALRAALAGARARFHDRALGWGSQLYRATVGDTAG